MLLEKFSDIFTKEMRDGTHFQRLRDSFSKHLFWQFTIPDNCFPNLWFLQLHGLLCPLAFLPTLQLWRLLLSVEL
jgi:hypothetical protein